MNCTEFQKIPPENVKTGQDQEYERHAESCTECSELIADLETIRTESVVLREIAEPSPRVWNRIEIALRQEGLIHEPLQPSPEKKRPFWRPVWLAPLATCGALALALVSYQRLSAPPSAGEHVAPSPTVAVKAKVAAPGNTPAVAADRQFLAMVASRPPAIRAKYEADLQRVNNYIRDAQHSVEEDPNDEVAQQYLMDAYQQKATMYQLALDRSLP